MQKGKGSTASPPAVANRGQQSSQRGPTPPQQRQDDYNQRNAQGYPTQGMNVQQVQMFQGMVQGQQRMPLYRNLTRPMRMPHHSQQSNQPMYHSPTGMQSMLQVANTGPPNPYAIPQQQFVPQQMDYQAVSVGNPQMQYRQQPQLSSGYNHQMNFPTYSPSMSQPPMPFVPSQQRLMYHVGNPPMQQNIGPQYQVPRQEQPAPRKKNIIKIRDPNQDNKDVTEEILSSAAHSIPASEANASGHSSSSNTPPINSNTPQESTTSNDESVKKQFEAQVAARLHEDSKSKTPTPPTTTPVQITKSTSPKQIQTKTMSTVKVISIEKNNSRTVKKEEPKPEVEAAKPPIKPLEVVEPPTSSDEKPVSQVDGACISTESKPCVSTEDKPCITESKPCITESKPCITESKPSITENKPSITESKPCITESKPCTTENKPCISTEDKPCISTESKPCISTESKPCTTEDKPCISTEDKPCISTESKPEPEKPENEVEKKESISESKTLESSNKTEISNSSEPVSTAESISTDTTKPESELSAECKEIIVPNGSISPNEELIKPEETKEIESAPPVDDSIKSDLKTVEETETKVEAEPEIVACTFENVESSESSEKPFAESSVNGIESEPNVKPVIPAATTTEPVKRKKQNKKFKDYDKKPESDLMDAYREVPVKQDVKEEPEEPKEPAKEVQEEKVPSEDETWEDKDEKSGNWSPESEEIKDGPRSYDRDFLLQFQFNPVCTAKPAGLPDIEVVLNTINNRQPIKQQGYSNSSSSRMGGGGGVDFMPSFMRPPGRPNQSNMSNRGNKGRSLPKKIVHTIESRVELNKTENRWVRPSEAEKTMDDDEKKTKETIRKFRSILNKLTPQKFQTLIQQILDLHIDTAERLEEIINITFEKAISEPAFSVAYANMCRCLVPKNVKVETEDGKDKTLTFRKILLNKCQKEFEKEKSEENTIHEKMEQLLKEGLSDDVLKVKKAELSAEELKGRRRTLGNIRFIGELFKLKMLTENIMHDCVIKLIKNNEEESYECLCKLLSTIGKDLDHAKAKPRMDQYFEQMKKVIDLKKTSSRCRFMLQDVIDLRNNNWVPRRDDNNPKTIDQIHKEVADEEKKTIMLIQQSRQSKRDAPNKGRDSPRPSGGGGGGGGVPQADETWTTVPNRTRNVNVDPKKFQDAKKRTNVDTESISLGPGGRGPGAWARGSSGGSGPASMPAQQNTEQETRGNRFSALGGEGRRGPGASRQGPGAGRLGTAGGRRPMQGDREKALEAVRNVVQAKPPPRQEERDTGSPRLEDTELETKPVTPSPPLPAVSPPVKQLSDEDVRNKAMGLADEYFDIKDLKEAMLCVEELDSCYHQQLVYHCLNHCLEKHSSERLAIAKLMFSLRKNNVLSEDNYLKGLRQLLEYAEDMEIDIPHVWNYFGELIGPLILDTVLPLSLIKDCSVTLITSKSKQAKLMVEILITAAKVASQEEVASLWSKSGLTFDDFFSSSDETQQFIKDKNIESIVSAGPKPKPHSAKIQEELRNLVLTKKANNEEVFKWIDTNVPEPKEPKFIRALITAVCQDCKTGSASGSEDSCDTSLFTRRSSLLKKYIDDNSSLELQALFALQALSVQLDHPPDFLKSFFNALYDEDVITEDAFFAWEKDTDPNEAQGKGTALSSTKHFFDWLRSAEEEKTDEG